MKKDSAKDANIIACPQCNIKNPIESDICYNCGAALHEIPAKKSGRPWIAVVVFFLFVAGVLYLYFRPDGNKDKARLRQKGKKRQPQSRDGRIF